MCVLMISAKRSIRQLSIIALCCLAWISACERDEGETELIPTPVFPGAAPLAHRHRNHSMTESPDGRLRIYVAQKGDVSDLMIMSRLADGEWGAPSVLDLPRRETNTSPRFFPDGTLYYSSDAPHPERPGRKDLNVWRVVETDGRFSAPEVLPDSINTGSNEDGFAPLGEGRAVFSSTTLGGVGGYDLYIAHQAGNGWIVTPFAHNTAMADSHAIATKDGAALIWYAHMPAGAVYGSVDLFVSHWEGRRWSAPQNLGPAINTTGIDYGAGISANGETLFFSRDGVLLEVNLETALSSAGFVTSHPDQ